MLESLKENVFKANIMLVEYGLVIFTWEMFLPLTVNWVWWSLSPQE
jgi:hypothetical protein